ncbi:hypothetical protein [Algicella marina]|uniref:Dihydroorotate dehydrogenase n=1 Tax=Algicella marina TaxID=2683284 RepID=A0A6P1SXP8_9RHOB|nr:hypothetical protein [Algicella marina]QHQ33986.1 hypothetical protein GO499_01700 [Algicella marina]
MSDPKKHSDTLDRLLADLRAETPAPTPELLARIVTDARMVQPRRQPGALARLRAVFSAALEGTGGWQGMGALAASALFGVWLGAGSGLPISVTAAEITLGAQPAVLEADTDSADDPFAIYLAEG